MRNHSYENDLDLHENETACRTHFHMKGFALRLVLKQRYNRTRKWPIQSCKMPLLKGRRQGQLSLGLNAGTCSSDPLFRLTCLVLGITFGFPRNVI